MLYIILVVRDKEINKIKENEMKTNSTITINDKTYNVNLKTKTYQYCSYVTAAGVASVLRQTLKEMKKVGLIGYKKLWVRSETYSGGNSIDVNTYGGTNTKLIGSVVNLFQEGNFNGMIDMYEYNGDKLNVIMNDTGEVMNIGVKYTFYYNKAPFGTVEYRKEQYVNDCLGKGVVPTKAGVDNWISMYND